MKKGKHRWPGLTIFRVYMGLFDYHVHVAIGPQAVAVQYVQWYHKGMLVDRDGVVGADDQRRGFCAYHAPYCPVIWLPRRPRTAREHATLAHECLHAVGHIARWAAIDHSTATEEVFCHALGHLVNGILEGAAHGH